MKSTNHVQEAILVEILILIGKSGLQIEEILTIANKRAEEYRKVKGLIQKLYVKDNSTGHIGGVLIFDSKENLEAYRNSDLAKSTIEAYKLLEPPTARILEVIKVLYEDKERIISKK